METANLIIKFQSPSWRGLPCIFILSAVGHLFCPLVSIPFLAGPSLHRSNAMTRDRIRRAEVSIPFLAGPSLHRHDAEVWPVIARFLFQSPSWRGLPCISPAFGSRAR